MESVWPTNSSYLTPLCLNKKFSKLSLKKHNVNSCPPKQKNDNAKLDKNDMANEEDNNSLRRKSLEFYKDDFCTPPFVTTSRPKYKKQSKSTPNLSSDFIGNTPDNTITLQTSHSRSESFIRNTPSGLEDQEVRISDHDEVFTDDRLLGDKVSDENNEDVNKHCSMFDDVHTCSTPQQYYNPLSPQSAKIMTSIYGDVWTRTPGLFKKKDPLYKSKVVNKNYDQMFEQFSTLQLSPSDDKETQRECDRRSREDDYLLKPKMLSFDNEANSPERKESPTGSRERRWSADESDDLSFSFKKKNRRNKILSSSSSNNSDENLFKHNCIEKDPDLDDSRDKLHNHSVSNTKSHVRIEHDLECSVILIETDTEVDHGKDKYLTDKKTRKLFTKRKNVFDDVEFVSEQPPNEIIKSNRVFEIIDDDFVTVQRDIETKKVIGVVDDKPNKLLVGIDDFISNIEVKTKPVIKVKRKPRERKKGKENVNQLNAPPTKEQNPNINLDNLEVYGFMASLSDTIPSWRCNKEAKHYKEKFKSKKCELTQKLFSLYNENVYSGQLDANLPITWSSTLITTAGRAYNKIKKSQSESGNKKGSSVELSIKVVDTAQRLRDTLAHELCHVAAWLIDGQLRDGHGPYWKKWVAKTLQVYPELGSIPVCHSLDIYYKYTFKCIRCGYGVNRHSKSIDVTKKACGYCGGRFECIHNKKNKDGLVVSTPVKRASRELKGFALYVKENYGNVRGSNTPHKQAMQYLGKQYAKMRAAQGSSSESMK